jgi:hypothetical protein
VPTSHSTTASWILKAYEDTKLQVVQSLENATPKATLSFDGWTANNKVLDLLGIVTHYLDKDYKNHVVVLGLRDTLGSHSGVNMADHLLSVINDFSLSDKIAYFTADNAINNDKALSILSGFCPQMNIDPVKHRLRCTGHIYNLVCKAILYGVDGDCIDDTSEAASQSMTTVTAFEATMHNGTDEAKLIAWRKKGPIGKLHNTVIHIKDNAARRNLFISKQRQSRDDSEDSLSAKIYRVVANGGIR